MDMPCERYNESVAEFLIKTSIRNAAASCPLHTPTKSPSTTREQTSGKSTNEGYSPQLVDRSPVSDSAMYMASSQGLSQKLIDQITTRQINESVLRQRNDEILKQEETKRQIDELTKTSNQLMSFFSFNQVVAETMKKVLESLVDSQRGSFQSKEFLKDQIQTLCTMAPDVFKVIKTQQGQMLKIMNKKVTHIQMREKIVKYILGQNSKIENVDVN